MLRSAPVSRVKLLAAIDDQEAHRPAVASSIPRQAFALAAMQGSGPLMFPGRGHYPHRIPLPRSATELRQVDHAFQLTLLDGHTRGPAIERLEWRVKPAQQCPRFRRAESQEEPRNRTSNRLCKLPPWEPEAETRVPQPKKRPTGNLTLNDF